ncbi:outer membrane efflux protein [Pseudomonas chlororaphis subsp. aurantiaca]|uniref:TolC family protein n=1 Tax=Pseudomonas chlororaphis TaxID=587753 RepID=UPI0008660414|nr:outer membrane efflux protein [Pseudomonas chlororaphis subsp. aurantiaca]
MKAAFACPLLACLCTWSQWTVALNIDVFATERDVSRTAIKDVDSVTWSCEVGPVPALLTLEDMIERVLCHDPQTRQAWANAKAQAALVGVKQSAYLPRLNGSSGITSGRNDTAYEQREEYSSQGHQRQLDNRLSLSWILFDFGRREAALRNARQLLVAANANQDRQLQETFVLAAQLYYDTLAAQRSQIAASQVAALAAENLKAAGAKYEAGAAALSDRLQAQAAYSQASLNEVRGNGALRSAKGLIALRMGLPPQTPLELAGSLTRRPDTQFVKSVDELLEQARQDHPSLIAAKAKLDAAKAVIDESRAAGRPTLSFIANISDVQTNQSAFNGNTRVRDNSVGLQLNIPLFEGFERAYQVRGAQAQLEASEAELSDVEQRISLELWANYQTLSIETRSLERTAEWVEQSNQALQVVQGRYRSGVGSMIELLNALTAYATAEQQHINALNSWQMARLKLAASLGRLGFWAL